MCIVRRSPTIATCFTRPSVRGGGSIAAVSISRSSPSARMPDPGGIFIRSATSSPSRSSRPLTGTPISLQRRRVQAHRAVRRRRTSAAMLNGTDTPFFSVAGRCSTPFSNATVTSRSGDVPGLSAQLRAAWSATRRRSPGPRTASAACMIRIVEAAARRVDELMNSPSSDRTSSTTPSASAAGRCASRRRTSSARAPARRGHRSRPASPPR